MKNGKNQPPDQAELRRRAEGRVAKKAAQSGPPPGDEETRRLLHELQVHQAELEMQNEELLRASQDMEANLERYSELYDFAPVSYLSLDGQGVIKHTNLTCAALLGITRGSLLGLRFIGLIDQHDQTAFRDFLERWWRKDKSQMSIEVRLAVKDHGPRYALIKAADMELMAAQHELEQGMLCHLAVMDITERRQAEDDLLKSETKYRLLVDTQKDLVASFTPEGKFIFVNDAYCKLFNKAKDELIGSDWQPILIADDLAHIQAELAKLSPSNPEVIIENRVIFSDGEIHWIQFINKGLFDSEGKLLEIRSVGRDITERKLAEEKVALSAEYWQATFDSSRDAIWVLDRDQQVLLSNKAATVLFQRDKEEVVGRRCWEIVHGASHPIPECPLLRARVSLRRETMELRIGDDWFLVVVDPILDASGEYNGAVHIVTDISSRKNAENSLRAERDKFQNYLDVAGVMLGALDREGHIILINKKGCLMLGRSENELLGRDWFSVCLPDDIRDETREVFHSILSGTIEPYIYYENEILTKQGERRLVAFHNAFLEDASGEHRGVIFSGDDITERRIAEDRIRLNESRLQCLYSITSHRFESTQELLDFSLHEALKLTDSKIGYIYLYDAETKVFTLNSWSKHVMTECQVANPQRTYHRELTGLWGEAVRQGKTIVVNDYSASSPLNKGFPPGHVELHRFMTLPIFSGEVIAAVVGVANKDTAYDQDNVRQLQLLMDAVWKIVERRAATDARRNLEAQLRQTQKMEALGALAGGIAHDFNNILSAIIGYSELLITRDTLPAKERGWLEAIREAGDRAKDLVAQILAFSRQSISDPKPIMVASPLREALKLLRASLPATVELHQDIQADSGKIMGDPTQIHQIVMNLCTNASHAMRDTGGVLKVSLDQVSLGPEDVASLAGLKPGSHLRITVSDTGHGIAPEVMDRIFDPFFTTKSPGEGTGIGLSVVHSIVEGHGGQITVESRPGQGATFKVFFPLIEAVERAPDLATAPSPLGKGRVLLVDDEETLTNVGRLMLGRLGYEVTTCNDPMEAMQVFRAQPQAFDMVITDQIMPKMSGARLAAELMAIRRDLPVILYTGSRESITPEEANSLGIRRLMYKPLSMRALGEGVREALGERPPEPR